MLKLLLPVLCLLFIAGVVSAQPPTAQKDSIRRARDPYRLISGNSRPVPAEPATPKAPVPGSQSAINRNESNANTAVSVPLGKNIVKNIDNGLNFTVTSCTGNAQDQTVTLYFTFSNPGKPHQLITLSFRKFGTLTNALDAESKEYAAGQITLGGESNSNTYRTSVKQLPTGNILKGAITFINVLPAVHQFSLVNIITESCNAAGGSDKKLGLIEIQNVPVSWVAGN